MKWVLKSCPVISFTCYWHWPCNREPQSFSAISKPSCQNIAEKNWKYTNKAREGEKEWRSGESTHLPLLWPNMASHVGWVSCWFFSLLKEFFSGSFQFSSLHKNQHSKFQFDLETVGKKSHLVECPLLNSHLFLLFYPIKENEMCRTKSHSRAKIVKNPSTRVQTL